MYEQGVSVEEICNNLSGQFAFILYDQVKDEFYAARDHIGIAPIYYGLGSNGEVYFSSEMKAI